MKVKDLIREDIDIDVCDTYDERCYLAFVGPLKLTSDGEAQFSKALDIDVEINQSGDMAALICDTAEEAHACAKFFWAAAGYVADSLYQKWFVED